MKNILIVDDETDIRNLIQGILEDEGYSIRQAANSQQAYKEIEETLPDLIIQDIWLQNSEHDGLEILDSIKEQYPYLPFVMISGHGNIEVAVNAIKRGAYDFIEKPFKSDRLILMIDRALENAQLKIENESLKRKTSSAKELIGSSSAMQQLRDVIKRVAPTNSRILLTGAPGTGKDITAHTLHNLSERSGAAFITINCAVLRPDRLEVELFGAEAGLKGEPAHTGVLEQAHNGTLFLDEVADMPLETQGKIVRVLQEQKFQRVGGQEQIDADVRIISSSNKDLQSLIKAGKFREDLFYRLSVVPVGLPPLSAHTEDIPELAEFFSKDFSVKSGTTPISFSEEALDQMQRYTWPGNVRQLKNAVEWVMIMSGDKDNHMAELQDLPPQIRTDATVTVPKQENDNSKNLIAMPLRDAREYFERGYLELQIKRFNGNISKTAQFIGMERSALHRKLKQLGISDSNKHNNNNSKDDTDQVKSSNIA